VVPEIAGLAELVDESAFVEVAIERLENGHTTCPCSTAIRCAIELERPREPGGNLRRPRFDEAPHPLSALGHGGDQAIDEFWYRDPSLWIAMLAKREQFMFDNTKAFSGLAVDDLQRARVFYERTLGIRVSESNDLLTLHLAGERDRLVYPKPDGMSTLVRQPRLDELVFLLRGQRL
jgi:hypothetical protein